MSVIASLALSMGQGVHLLALSSGGAVNIDFDLTFVGQMVIFAALIVVMKPLLYDPVLALFAEREKRTDGAKAEARAMQEKAGELLRKWETELEKVQRVAAEERDRTRAETARLEAEQMNEARHVAAKIVEDGRASIQKEVQSIQFELGRDSEKLAREIASKVLGREIA